SAPLETLSVLLLAASLLSSSGLSSLHPDIITLPLTPDIITLVQHSRSFRCLNRCIRLNLQTNLDTEAQYWKLTAAHPPKLTDDLYYRELQKTRPSILITPVCLCSQNPPLLLGRR